METDTLPDLTQHELAAVIEWARRVKGTGRWALLRRCPETGEVVRDTVAETERPAAIKPSQDGGRSA